MICENEGVVYSIMFQISQDRLVFGTEVAQKVHDTWVIADCCPFHPQTHNC